MSDQSFEETLFGLHKTVSEIAEKNVLHDSVLEELKNDIATVEDKASDLRAVENNLEAIRKEILKPVEIQMRAGVRFSRLGFIFGLAGIVVSVLATIMSFNLAKSTSARVMTLAAKETVALIIPIQDERIFPPDYGTRQLGGFVALLESNQNFRKFFDYTIIDSKGIFTNPLCQEISEEMARGTKYFLATESRVCVQLAQVFDSLYDEVSRVAPNPQKRPILVCTSASSPQVETKPGSIYRFYIRSMEEAEALIESVKNTPRRNALIIAIDDDQGSPAYGRGAAAEIEQSWVKIDRRIIDTLYLEPNDDATAGIGDFLEAHHDSFDVIFVASFGKQLVDIVMALSNQVGQAFPPSTPILITAPLNITSSFKATDEARKKIEWTTCVPEIDRKQLPEKVRFNSDVEVAHVYYTLDKLVHTIQRTKSENRSFSECWGGDYPGYLDLKYSQDGSDVGVGLCTKSRNGESE